MDREINHKRSRGNSVLGGLSSRNKAVFPRTPTTAQFHGTDFPWGCSGPISTRPLTQGQGQRRKSHRLGPETTEAATSPTSGAGRTWKMLHKDRSRPELVPA